MNLVWGSLLGKNFFWWRGAKGFHLWEDKSKSILFSTKNWKKNVGAIDKSYCSNQIKQYSMVHSSDCKLDKNLSGKTMVMKVIKKDMVSSHFWIPQPLGFIPCLACPAHNVAEFINTHKRCHTMTFEKVRIVRLLTNALILHFQYIL